MANAISNFDNNGGNDNDVDGDVDMGLLLLNLNHDVVEVDE